MEDIKHWDDLHLKTSRISFFSNYIIAGLAIIFLVLFINRFNLGFDFFPETKGEMFSTLIILGLVLIPTFLIEQPEWIRFMRQYTITFNEVIEVEGLLNKRKIILPYQSISEVTVRQSLVGRMLNYGDVYIGAYRQGSDINIKGARNAKKIHELIQYRINILREGQLVFFKDKDGKKGEKPKKQEKENKPEKNKSKPDRF